MPANLDSVASVNFVLTQEPGKLKPKDLKLAIERNRAEREHRAEEQRKLREEGGGAGILDLRGVLAEEKLNAKDDDPFQRQLREMAFLADVDEVEKLENEKAFRISEDYLGANLMSEEDINFVYRQREMTRIIQMKSRWRNRQNRQKTAAYTPIHPSIKAGVPKETTQQLINSLQPQFDPNKNDIWQKRLNTLRRFVYLVSKWLVRNRLDRRMNKVLKYFHDHNAYSRSDVRAFIEQENRDHRTTQPSTSAAEKEEKEKKAAALAALNAANKGAGDGEDGIKSLSAAEVVFSKPNVTLLKILRNHQIIQDDAIRVKEGQPEITSSMANRNLYPVFDRNVLRDDRSAEQRGLLTIAQCLTSTFTFDDRSFFHQKIQPDFQYRAYQPHSTASLVPLHLPACREKHLRKGAPEEKGLREAADLALSSVQQRSVFYQKHPQEPVEVVDAVLKEVVLGSGRADATETVLDEGHYLPAWISRASESAHQVLWSQVDTIDHLTPLPQFRGVAPPLLRSETDALHPLRPHAPPIDMQRDASLRNRWQAEGAGYLSSHYYLLGQAESRWRDAHVPAMGPLLSDYYQPDHDRHVSGLHCFARDHLRDVHEWDADVAPLQRQLDPKDKLTDSESDNDDDFYYASLKPSMEKVKAVLRPPKKEVVEEPAKGAKGKATAPAKTPAPATPAPAPVTMPGFLEEDSSSLFGDDGSGVKNREQVELLRDRKTLDVESTLWRERKSHADEVYRRQVQISHASASVYGALRVQLPFHVYEDHVYQQLTQSQQIAEHSNVFVEVDPHKAVQASRTSLGSLQTSAPTSPVKKA